MQDLREVVPPNAEPTTVASVDGDETTHGIEVAVEFKPIEHPTEPLDYDQPIQCPLPEPSILNVSLYIIFHLSSWFYYLFVECYSLLKTKKRMLKTFPWETII